jgi:hypothetical protein
MVYSLAERVFILEYYFTSKSFAAVREAFSNAYPDKELPNKTTIQQLVTIRDTGSVCVSLRRWWTFSASAVKLFCKFFLSNRNLKATRLSCYIDVTSAYKYCCN